MTPSDRPANENTSPREPRRLWPRGPQVETVLSLTGILAIWGFAYLWLDTNAWRTVLVGLAVIFTVAFLAAGIRWALTGRA